MSNIARFAAYAAAFEKAVENDDWSVVEPYFTEDAVYDTGLEPPLGGRIEGRTAVLAFFKRILDRFDRRFASREVSVLEGPREEGDSVWARGRARYTAEGVPDLVFDLEETAHFAGEGEDARIRRLVDRYAPEEVARMEAYLDAHGARLGISLDDEG